MVHTRRLVAGGALGALIATTFIAPVAAPAFAAVLPSTSVKINEVVTSGGDPGDWIEFLNTGGEPVNLSGFIVRDDKDSNVFTFADGTIIAPGEYLVIDAVEDGVGDFDFGLGKEDQVRLFDPANVLIDEVSWSAHGAPSWGRLDSGELQQTLETTKGTANVFETSGGGSDDGEPSTGPGGPGDGESGTHASGLRLNEIIYDKASGYEPDQVELINTGATAVTLNGWSVADDKKEPETLPDGITVEPGAFFVLLNGTHFSFGLGKGDAFYLYDAAGAEVDGYEYVNTAPLATWARCTDGVGDWQHATVVTPGAPNVCAAAEVPGSVVLNEVDSGPADWVELYNPGTAAFDIGGYELRDNSNDHRWRFTTGTTIAAGEFKVVDADSIGLAYNDVTDTWSEVKFSEPIGIGSADEIRLYNAAGEQIDTTGAWTSHAAIDGDEILATLARCVDGVGAFELAYATPGAPNRCVPPAVVINEVESNGDTNDWVEIMNIGATPVDISGWTIMDNDPVGHANDVTPLAAGTMLAPGAFFVFEELRHFGFGLGANDQAILRNAAGQVVDEHIWAGHAKGVYARCVDGTGEFRDLEVSTKGLENACGNPVRINEVVTNPVDWIELVNPTGQPIDVSGIIVKDDDDSHAYVIPAGTEIAAGGYFVIEADELGFGLGKADQVRLFEGENLIGSTSWGPDHPLPSWGRCPDVTGPFAVTATATKGEPNFCEGEFIAGSWPGATDTLEIDQSPMFLSDSSGLDTQSTSEGDFLWAVDNGTGTFWKLAVSPGGAVAFADGWATGKRARFQKDAANPAAAGPDAEGITIADDGFVYLAVERDNSAKGVNYNVVMQLDPNEAGPDVVASQEWNLTNVLPAVGANLGLEAIEWVADADLAGKLWDDNTKAPYDPANYAGHGSGLFFVGIEDRGQLFAVALLPGGEAEIVAELTAGLGGIMALDYDTVLGVLWAVCDDGCSGTLAQITLNGSDTPDVAHVLPPAGLPNINNEGFATAPAASAVNGQRPAWWFADGYDTNSLRVGQLSFAGSGTGGDGGDGGAEDGGGDGRAGAGQSAGADLANTGSSQSPAMLLTAGSLLVLAAGVVLATSRRRATRQAAAGADR